MRRSLLPKYLAATLVVVISLLFVGASRVAAADTDAPAVTLESPVTGGDVTLPYPYVPIGSVDLVGTVSDATGVAAVRLQVQRRADDHFWNGTGWQVAPAWNTAIVTSDSWTLPAVSFDDEGAYAIRFATSDTVGNVSGVRDNPRLRVEVVDDVTPPTAQFLSEALHGIVRPVEPTVYETETPFLGGSYHVEVLADDEIGVAAVAIQVFRSDPAAFWNGNDWQASPVWVSVPLGDRLTFTPWRTETPIDFGLPGTYTVRMNLRDFAGNIANGAANPKLTVEVAADTTPPVARLTTPRWEFAILPGGGVRPGHPTLNTISPGIQRIAGQAADEGTGVESVRVQIERRTATAGYWNGSGWQTAPVWVTARLFIGDNPNLIGWRVLQVDMSELGQYVVRLSSTDLAGNRSGAAGNWKSFLRVE